MIPVRRIAEEQFSCAANTMGIPQEQLSKVVDPDFINIHLRDFLMDTKVGQIKEPFLGAEEGLKPEIATGVKSIVDSSFDLLKNLYAQYADTVMAQGPGNLQEALFRATFPTRDVSEVMQGHFYSLFLQDLVENLDQLRKTRKGFSAEEKEVASRIMDYAISCIGGNFSYVEGATLDSAASKDTTKKEPEVTKGKAAEAAKRRALEAEKEKAAKAMKDKAPEAEKGKAPEVAKEKAAEAAKRRALEAEKEKTAKATKEKTPDEIRREKILEAAEKRRLAQREEDKESK